MGVWMRTGNTASAWSLVICAGVGLSVAANAAASTSTSKTRSGLVVDEPKNEPKNEPKAEPAAEPGTPAQPATGSAPGTNKPPVNEPVIDVKKQAQKPRPGQVMPGDGASAVPAKPAPAPASTSPASTAPQGQAPVQSAPAAEPVRPTQPATQPAAPSRQPVGDVPRLRPIVVNRPAGASAPSPAANSGAASTTTQPAPQAPAASNAAVETPRAEPTRPAPAPAPSIESMKPIERITPEPIERPVPTKVQPAPEPARVETVQPTPVEPAASPAKPETVQTRVEPELPRMQPIEPAKPAEPAKPLEAVKPVESAKVAEPKAAEPTAPAVPPISTPTPEVPVLSGGDSPLSRVRDSVVISPVSLTVESQSGLVQWRSVEANAAGDEGWAAMSVGEVIAGQVELRTGPLSEVTLRSVEGEVITLRRLSRVRVYRLQAPSDEAGVRAPSRLTAELSRGRMSAVPAPTVAPAQANAPVRRSAVSVLVDGSLVLVREATEIGLDARGLTVRNVEADAPAGTGK